MYSNISEITSDIYRLCLAPTSEFSYVNFLILDEHPLLIHTGRAKLFQENLKLLTSLMDVEKLSYIAFSHAEADECGALNDWLKVAEKAVVLVGPIGIPTIDDLAIRKPRCVEDGEIITLGQRSITVLETPHCPHNWDACMFYELHDKILFSSDLGAQGNVREPVTEEDRSLEILEFQHKYGFMAEGVQVLRGLDRIEKLDINFLATHHGSVLRGTAIAKLFKQMRQVLGEQGGDISRRVNLSCSDFS